MTVLFGRVQQGVVVLNEPCSLPNGTRVNVHFRESVSDRTDNLELSRQHNLNPTTMTQPIQFPNEPRSNAARQVVSDREALALRTFTPSQAVLAKSAAAAKKNWPTSRHG